MSRHKTGKSDSGLPLPSPTSPRAVDDKVLAYARRKAGNKTPGRAGLRGHPWATGLATASVVALALFISEPQQPSPTLQLTPMTTESTVDKPAAAARASMPEGLSSEMDMASDAPQQKTAKSAPIHRMEIIGHTSAGADSTLLQGTQREQTEDRQELLPTLERCAQLLRAGDGPQARLLYQQLREGCPACDLPDSLEAALENNLEDY